VIALVSAHPHPGAPGNGDAAPGPAANAPTTPGAPTGPTLGLHRGARGEAPDVVRVALDVSRLTVTRMAEELGIPRATLAAYRLGTRRMPAASRARLATYLAAHAELLRRLSRLLEGEA
jgi:hypothetical protein